MSARASASLLNARGAEAREDFDKNLEPMVESILRAVGTTNPSMAEDADYRDRVRKELVGRLVEASR
jgi:hypothetical protein